MRAVFPFGGLCLDPVHGGPLVDSLNAIGPLYRGLMDAQWKFPSKVQPLRHGADNIS